MSGVLKASRKVEVHFVDFGNREVVECEELRDMPAILLNSQPIHAIACSLYGVHHAGSISMWSPHDVATFSDLVSDQLVEVLFTSDQNADGHYLVHLMKDRENINRKFLQPTGKLAAGYSSPVDRMAAGDASLNGRHLSTDSGSVEDGVDGLSLRGYKYEACKPGEELRCVAAYVVSPSRFFVHKSTDTAAVEALIDELTAEYKNRPSSKTLDLSVGQPCCALYGEDSRWYRAKLVSTSDEQRRRLSVEFVDFGNTEMVDVGVVHRLRSRFFTRHVQAMHCQLAGVVPVTGSSWSDDAAAFFEEALGEAVHVAKVVSESEFIHTVEMKSIAQKLIDARFAKWKVDPAATAKSSGWTSAPIDSNRTSRPQHEIETKKSTSLQLTGMGSGSFATGSGGFSARSGSFVEEKDWTADTDDGITSFNNRTSRPPRESETKSTSWQPSGAGSGSFAAASGNFAEKSGGFAAGSGSFSEAGTDNAVTSFTPMAIAADTTRHPVVISWVVLPSEFYCQMADNRRIVEKLSTDLCAAYQGGNQPAMNAADCTVGKPCIAFYAADSGWYRGHVVSVTSGQVKVLYVDYGNTEVVPIRQVRPAQLQFLKSPPIQAIRCCLRGAEKADSQWTKDQISAFDGAASAPGVTCRIVDIRDDIYIVELSDKNGRDITSQFCCPSVAAGKGESSSITGAKSTPSTAADKATAPSQLATKVTYTYECGLKQNDVVTLEVVYIADGSTVFNCHVVGQTDELDELMAKLATDCESRPALDTFPDVGAPCSALYSEDGSWYRAIVDSAPADDTEHRTVKFVDYGNVESCDVSSLRELDSRFLHVPVRRIDARIRGMTATSLDGVVDDLLGQQFTATVITVDRNNIVTVDLKAVDTGESFQDIHEDLFTPSTTALPHKDVFPSSTESFSLPTAELPHEEVDVYVTHVVSPSDFYIQSSSVEQQLTELADQLMEEYDNGDGAPVLSDVTVGGVCCGRYSVDGSWYRAIVEDIKDDTLHVRFVDYGNDDDVPRSDVRQLIEKFRSIPVCSWHCQLSAHSDGDAICWTDTQREKFVELIEGGEKVFRCSFISRSESPYRVILKDEGVDVGQMLCGSEPAIGSHVVDGGKELPVSVVTKELPVAKAPTNITDVCVTSANSPSDFYVQLASVEDELLEFADELFNHYDGAASSNLSGDVEVGTVCCAPYSGAWYRAIITDIIGPDEARVLYVDYGNSEVVSTSTDLKELDDKFCTKPPFTFHCELSGVGRPMADWTDEMKTKFTSATMTDDEVPVVFKCQFIGHDVSTGRHSVSLKSDDGLDLSTLFVVSETDEGREVTDEGHEVTDEGREVTDGGSEMRAGADVAVADVTCPQPYQPAVISPGKHRVSRISLSMSSYLCVCVCVYLYLSVCVYLSLGLCVSMIVSLCAV